MKWQLRFSVLAWLVAAASASAQPTVSITSPINLQLSNVYQSQNGSDDVAVTGSVGGTNLRDWKLEYRLAPSGGWVQIASGTAPKTGMLGTWSTLGPPLGPFNVNGVYSLKLTACSTSNVCTYTTTVNNTVSNFYLTQSTPSGQPELNNGQLITYTATIPWALSVTLSFKNLAGAIVKSAGTTTSGATTWPYQWNGTNTGGVRVPDGPYFVVASVTDFTNTLNWDETSIYLGTPETVQYIPQPADYDPFNNDPLPIPYNFGVGKVTIAVAPPEITEIQSCAEPGVFCILDHKYEESGPHTIQWAGVDQTGKFRPEVGQLAIVSDRLTFSKNAVVLYGTKPTVANVTVTPPVAWSGASQVVAFDVTGPTPIATRQLKFLNQESLTVLRTITSASCVGTHCTSTWDGKADNGMLVAPGSYTITVSVTDTLGNVASAQDLAFIQF
jgi:flagellar hook assembly protein FlgD